MPLHDWTRVPAGIFHAFHHEWISELSRALNGGLLPDGYYALPEQMAGGFGPDVLALQAQKPNEDAAPSGTSGEPSTLLKSRPKTRFFAETEGEFYRRKKKSIAIRHVSGDRLIAMIEVVSPGNKAGRKAFQTFVEKACDLLEQRIHLLILDPLPPGLRDPQGVHGAIWQELNDDSFSLPRDKPLTLAAYECDLTTRAYIETLAVGDALPEMPLFLEPNGCVLLPLEKTYQQAFAAMPERWRTVLEGG